MSPPAPQNPPPVPSEEAKEMSAPQKRKPLKVVVKKRQAKRKPPLPAGRVSNAVPKVLRRTNRDTTAATELGTASLNEPDNHELLGPEEANLFDDLPCDTFLTLRSLVASQQGLACPLVTSHHAVVCVLESQLRSKLESLDGSDSIVTQELLELIRDNSVRRLPFSHKHDSSSSAMAIMETKDYVRGVWDAYRAYNSNNEGDGSEKKDESIITSWFASNLSNWTGRTVSHEELSQCWNESSEKRGIHSTRVVDTLVKMTVLQSHDKSDAYWFWLPNWGKLVLKSVSDATTKVMRQLKRSYYKELSQKHLESQSYSGLSGAFLMHHLISDGIVKIRSTPSGTFIKLS